MEGLKSRQCFISSSSILILLLVFFSLTKGSNGDCNMDHAEEGAKLCSKAFKDTYENNKMKVVQHPKKTGCCLSYNMGDCVKYAFTKAKCSPEEHLEMASLLNEKVEEAQSEINKGASYIGSVICGEQNRAKCGHLVEEYDKAKVQIDALNGAYSALVTPFLAVACTVIALCFS